MLYNTTVTIKYYYDNKLITKRNVISETVHNCLLLFSKLKQEF